MGLAIALAFAAGSLTSTLILWSELRHLRRKNSELEDRLGVGDECARRQIVANFRARAIEYSKGSVIERHEAVSLLALANRVEDEDDEESAP